ncbi:MAG: hypothetical protein HY904_04420 [Deltaproteobacteria bacterium]|nr:hypothetical protein [Deltaproteobacteria bacterium]
MIPGTPSHAWVARIAAVGEASVRARALLGDLCRLPADSVVAFLADIQVALACGDQDCTVFMVALQDVLGSECLPYDTQAALYREAARQGLTPVQRLLLAPPAAQQTTPKVPKKQPEGNDTLGARTWHARKASGPILERLVRDDDPRVVRNLLLNPRVTEKEVLKIATRRPATSEVLEEVARNTRWNRREQVRRALVFNPYTPVEIALGFLPFLHRADLMRLAGDARVHVEVSRQAAAVLPMRPPSQNKASAGVVAVLDAANEDKELP